MRFTTSKKLTPFSRRETVHTVPRIALVVLLAIGAVAVGQCLNAALCDGEFTLRSLAMATLSAPFVMGFLRTKIGPSANAVASGKTATINVPVGRRYHTITLVYGYDGANASKETAGTAVNQILGDIRVKLNGKTQRIFTAKQLNAMNSSNGDASGAYAIRTSGTMGSSGYREYLTIYFAEPWRKDISEQQATAWNVHPDDVASFQIEVDFQTITSPFLDWFYTADALTGRLGMIEKVIRQTFATAGTSIDVGTIQRPKGNFLQAIHLFATSDSHYVNKAKLTANGEDVQDLIDYLSQRAKLFSWGMNPDTNANSATNYLSPRFDLVLDYDDPLVSVLPLENLSDLTLRLEFDATSTGTIDALVVRSGPAE